VFGTTDTSKSFTISVTVHYSFSVSNDAMVQVYEHAGALLGQNIEPLSGTSSKTYTFSLIAPSTPKTWKLNIHTFYKGEGPGGWVQDDIESIYIKVKPKPTPTPSLAKETASKLINSVSTEIDALNRKNVDTSLIEQALSKAKDSYEFEKYDEAIELAQNAQKMADNAYETAGHIESAQSEIDVAKSIGADVTDAESKLKDAKDALNKGDYEYARSWTDEASELAKHASVGSVKIIDLKALATKYDLRTVLVSGTIRDIETVYGKGYTFALDDGTGMISVVYEGGLGDIKEGDKVTVSGAFQASAGTVVADNVQKSGVGDVPGFEAIFAIAGLLAVAYLIRRRRRD
jgi:PGF-CTERM protein